MASLPAPAENHTAELSFDGVAYTLAVRCVGGDALEVVVERKEDAAVWNATFTAKYVEEITAKTGSFKRFPVFVKMLLSAARQESDSVFVDLLSYADLELLRSKRASASSGTAAAAAGSSAPGAGAGGPAPSASAAAAAATKRYLILTYAAEFDRVHYPLPLAYEEHPDPARLQATIRQLRAQLAAAGPGRSAGGLGRARGHSAAPSPSTSTAAGPETRQLRDENAALRARVAGLERQLEAGGGALAADVQALAADAQEAVADLRGLRRERDSLLLRAQQAEAALEGERNLHRRELRRRARGAADLEAELGAAKDQIRELRLRCRELAQELDLAQRRAQVAAMSAGIGRQPGAARRMSGGGSGGGGGGGGGGRGAAFSSPAGSRYHSRDISPAPIRRAPLPGPPPRSRSADVSRPSSRPSSRPAPRSAGRFDPTEYIRLKQEREREAARRLDDMRRAARLQSPRSGSLAGSRPPSMPSSRHSTPQRSRVPSRDPSADRARQRSAERSRPPQGDPRERAAAVRSTERLRAAVATTSATAPPAFPPRDQRSASPGRALQEVRQRLHQYAAASQPAGGAGSRPGAGDAAPAAPQRPRVPPTGDNYADASAEIADIDGRLQSLQAFLRSAKAGQPLAVPV